MEWIKECDGRWESGDRRWAIIRNDVKDQFVVTDNGRLVDHRLFDNGDLSHNGDVLVFDSKKNAKNFAKALQTIEDLWVCSTDPSWREFDLMEESQ